MRMLLVQTTRQQMALIYFVAENTAIFPSLTIPMDFLNKTKHLPPPVMRIKLIEHLCAKNSFKSHTLSGRNANKFDEKLANDIIDFVVNQKDFPKSELRKAKIKKTNNMQNKFH